MSELAHQDDDDIYYTDLPVGEILRRSRLNSNLTLKDVERDIRIRSIQIDCIERGEYESLPGRVYVIGFIRSYSDYLGLDAERMVGLFKDQDSGRAHDPKLQFPVTANDSKTPPVWLVLFTLLITAGFLFYLSAGPNRNEDIANNIRTVGEYFNAPSSDENNQNASQSEQDLAAQGQNESGLDGSSGVQINMQNTDLQTTQPQPDDIILTLSENSWVEIKDSNGQTLVSEVLQAGDVYSVPNRPDLTMSLGNAGGLSVRIGETQLDAIGTRGQVLRDIPLNSEQLKTLYSSTLETEL